ncbi:MAG: hypothetical protein ACREQV_24135, partial [Candidatus Binatia bacterium]
MDDVRTTYENLLSELRRGPGCTVERLGEEKFAVMVQALQFRLSALGKTTSLHECREELRAMATGLSDRKIREAFLVGFRFDSRYTADTVRERRGAYVQDLERATDAESKRLCADIRTLERRENKAIEIISRWLAEKHLQRAHATPLVTASRDHAELHVFRQSNIYFFSDVGAMLESNHLAWVRALVPNANPQRSLHYQYFAEYRRGVVSIQPRYGCKIVAQREAEGGAVEAVCEILKRLSPEDGEYSYRYDFIVRTNIRAQNFVRWLVVPPFAAHAEFHLIFHEKYPPTRAWWFHTSNDASAQIEP